MIGDFNAGPDNAEMQPVFAGFHDAWSDALQLGHATGNANSHGSNRIDYVFFVPGPTLSLISAEVVNTAALVGITASDHEPVVATFTVR
jgi:endonuclease/exonuclease/phosphatase (EEP) superfamily protein YafD